MNKAFLSAIISLFLLSCGSDKRPDDVLPPETMKEILIEASVIEGALKANFILGDSAKIVAPAFYNEVFIKHKTSREQFEQSAVWYFQHPEILENIQKEVINTLVEKGEESRK